MLSRHKDLKVKNGVMFGFELVWKMVILVVVAIATHCILRMRNVEDKSDETGKDCWQRIEF